MSKMKASSHSVDLISVYLLIAAETWSNGHWFTMGGALFCVGLHMWRVVKASLDEALEADE